MNNRIYFRFVGAAVLLLILSSCKDEKEGNTAPKYYPTEILADGTSSVSGNPQRSSKRGNTPAMQRTYHTDLHRRRSLRKERSNLVHY